MRNDEPGACIIAVSSAISADARRTPSIFSLMCSFSPFSTPAGCAPKPRRNWDAAIIDGRHGYFNAREEGAGAHKNVFF
ncbi:MAG TPA: hypothetical protein VN289_18020 [Paraburkholderia sp.]|nr:hypothetical protein [Paraburkholderia sp.]